MRNIITLALAFFLALLDVVNNYLIKNVSLNRFSIPLGMGVSMILYLIQPWILLKGFNFGSLTVLNLAWDLMSDILVTILGLWYFGEKIVGLKLWGVLFAFLAIMLFAIDDYKS